MLILLGVIILIGCERWGDRHSIQEYKKFIMKTARILAVLCGCATAGVFRFAPGASATPEDPLQRKGAQKCVAGDEDCDRDPGTVPVDPAREAQPDTASSIPPAFPAATRAEGIPSSPYALPLLGTYRKTMEIEDEIAKACGSYGVPLPLARAVCMYESGGDDRLTSGAGAHGYFQVMPATFRLMKVQTNIEAGVKYLGSLVREFGREDDALAAYNGGPGRVKKGRPMPIESLQYVVGVGIYRTLLTREEPEIREAASRLQLYRIEMGDTWATLAAKTGVPVANLRLYNPYLATRPLARGAVLAYPTEGPESVFSPPAAGSPPGPVYVTRRGDNYLLLAFAFDVDLDTFRKDNTLWRVQPPFEGMRLVVNARAQASDPGMRIAQGLPADDASAPADRAAGSESPLPLTGKSGHIGGAGGLTFVAEKDALDNLATVRAVVHKVRPGDTLNRIANLYGVSVAALRKANRLKRSHIRLGQVLKIPAA